MDTSLLKILRSVDTPTVCNAIEVVQGKRGFNGFTRGTMLASDPQGVMVGYAITAQIAATEPPQESPEIIRARRMAYYKAMAEGPRPAVAVVEDLDYPHAVGAYWGEVNTTIHKGFGLSGAFTNGVMRDLGDLAPDFPVVAASLGPSHGFVHVRSVNQPVSVMGVQVSPNDLVHADRHGGVVVPPDVVDKLAAAIKKMQATEQLILAPARGENFDFAAFEKAWSDFEKSRV